MPKQQDEPERDDVGEGAGGFEGAAIGADASVVGVDEDEDGRESEDENENEDEMEESGLDGDLEDSAV